MTRSFPRLRKSSDYNESNYICKVKVESKKLTQMQLELLKSLQHITDERQIREIKSLLNFYFRKHLDASIEKRENDLQLSAAIYQEWLASHSK